MPRPAGRVAGRQLSSTPHQQSPVKMTLNDDRGEKAARLQSRHALQEIQMNEIRAAASPMRKLNQNRPRYNEDSEPGTPQAEDRDARSKKNTKQPTNSQQYRQIQNDALNLDEALNTPNHRRQVPILANFEEWMKLATDNKINATNSWNFALIDYFHDMSLLKDGPGGQVNFQKASCTLDGCVKIYTSRVDSVATETGRLLSGLADSADGDGKKGKRAGNDDEEGEDGEDADDDEESGKKKQRKKAARSHEATLAPSFASLQLKKLELEFAVDPLFKKASADFDEGGAKGLLLNHLSIDQAGRIVFDSSDDTGDASNHPPKERSSEEETTEKEQDSSAISVQKSDEAVVEQEEDQEIDLSSLAFKFFPDLSSLDNKDICPSMKTFELGNPDSYDIPFIKASDDWKSKNKDNSPPPPPMNLNLADQTGIFLDGSNDLGFDDDDDDGALGGFDMPDNVGFGEGGEAWAKDAAIEPMLRVSNAEDDHIEGADDADGYTVSLQHRHREDAEQEMIHEYFDKAFNSRGKGKLAFTTTLENWRIQKIQKVRQSEMNNTTTSTTRQKKEKEPFYIDFLRPMSKSLKDLLEAPPANNSTISLPKSQLKTRGRNILDKDDELIDVKSMMRLWTKPKCRVVRRHGQMAVVDEGFGSKTRVGSNMLTTSADDDEDDIETGKGDYDANFFDDNEPALPFFDGPLPIDDDDDDGIGVGGDDDGGIGFVDAREMLSPHPEDRQLQQSLDEAINQTNFPPDTEEGGRLSDPFSSQQQQQPPLQLDLLPGSFGAQLVTQAGRRLRPEYVNYARTAKKVDVRALKENMWKGMSQKLISAFDDGLLLTSSQQRDINDAGTPPALTTDTSDADADADADEDIDMMDIDPLSPIKKPLVSTTDNEEDSALKFTDLMSDLKNVYPETQMKDISTSYCFICLLHLANEKGLVLESGDGGEKGVDGDGIGEDKQMNEIWVRRDRDVGVGYVGE